MPGDLPFIDEFETRVKAPPPAVFRSVARRMGGAFEAPGGRAFSGLLGCEHRGASYTVPPVEGQETNGFRVARVEDPRVLVLEGRHRFASYRLSFLLDPADAAGETRLRARTDAFFPGLKGALYRAAVIGSGGHRFIVKRLLKAVARGAERSVAA